MSALGAEHTETLKAEVLVALRLHDFEAVLREHYPGASSKQLTLTARLAAPFPLAKPGVP